MKPKLMHIPVQLVEGDPTGEWVPRERAERAEALVEQYRQSLERLFMQTIWAKVDKNGPVSERRSDLGSCWVWTAPTSHPLGYARVSVPGLLRGLPQQRSISENAHRVVYELIVGPIPDGLDLDHLCCVTRCVNPAHLEPVTRGENVLRGNGSPAQNARKTHCKRGHPFDEENTGFFATGGRICLACRRLRNWKAI